MLALGEIIADISDEISNLSEDIFPFLCNILSFDDSSQGADGGLKPDFDTAFQNIPCSYEPKTRYVQNPEAGKRVPIVQYEVMMPRKFNNAILDVKAGDRIDVLANGDEPGKSFEVIGVKNNFGVYLEAVCDLPESYE
jgi:hypothetical protein